MKLRIRGNSIRLRLLRPEVARLRREGRIEESISFGPRSDQKLIYGVQSASEVTDVTVRHEPNRITLVVPANDLQRWADSDEISMRGIQAVEETATLAILIEKDFKCADRDDVDGADAYDPPDGGPIC